MSISTEQSHILITGCAGFIGSNLLDRLLQEGHRVTGIDVFTNCYDPEIKRRNLTERSKNKDRFSLLEVDLRSRTLTEELDRQISGNPDVIIHLAGKTNGSASVENPGDYIEANLIATQRLLDYARGRGIEKFVQTSSASVYGYNRKLPWCEQDTNLLPSQPCAGTMINCESLGRIYSTLFGITYTALRLSTVYGPRQRPDMAIRKFTRCLHHEQPLPIHGNRHQFRDYVYIDDAVEAIIRSLQLKDGNFESINIASGKYLRLSEVIRELEALLGTKATISSRPELEGQLFRTHLSTDRAAERIGFRAYTPFREGLRQFSEWYALNCEESTIV